MKNIKKLGLLSGLVLLGMVEVAHAQVYNALESPYVNIENTLGTHVVSATTIVGTLAIAGLGIFAVIWGIRKFKSAVRAGA